MAKKAIIIGAGPAGLTAAYELLKRTDILPIILEKSGEIGGISRTIDYKGNRMDMGPHRFFSKSDRVMDWWLKMVPLEEAGADDVTISYQNKSRAIRTEDVGKLGDDVKPGNVGRSNDGSKPEGGVNPEDGQKDPDKVMLVIQRLTRIYFLRKFFAYPIQLSIDTLRTLGLVRTIKIMFSFLWIRLFPRKPENSLEDFIINKFGRQLYLLFFKDYTEKVWGVPCDEISAEWGAQRIKGVSLSKAVLEALKTMRNKKKGKADIGQKGSETSLIEQFLYPKKGPGSLWEEVARQVREMGGKIYFHQDVQKIYQEGNSITTVTTVNAQTGQSGAWEGDYFFSTMPVKELITGMEDPVPDSVREVAEGLQYRDFINVGILLSQLSGPGKKPGEYEKLELKDNWIYIQERDVKVGRLMIYNNWGGGMIKDPNTTWIGMEYFCNKTDAIWELDDETIEGMAVMELEKMGLARVDDVLDATVRKMEKTYPAYFGTYDRFSEIREFTDQFENLFLVGRNGMHKYNNADHSMLCAMVAVDNIEAGILSKDNLWSINTEQEYHEEKSAEGATAGGQDITKEAPEHSHTGQFPGSSFGDFLWKNPWNKAYVIFGFVAFLVQFIIFKFKYPFANYMPDSYSYIEAAARNLDVNMWPVAYSKFLRLVSVFSHSDKMVVGIQYFFFQASALTFLFTLIYFLNPGKIVRNVLYAFFIFNPLPLYVCNYISADALFIGLSLLWLTTLIWVIYRPSVWQIWVHGVLLLACFTVRYNAIYYPLVAALAFILAKQKWWFKVGGIALGLALVVMSYLYTSNKMFLETGQRQFSAFGGWQLANNALYMYEHIPAKERGPIPKEFAKLETMVREHMDTLKKVKLTADDSVNSYFYLWSGRGPLIQYLERDWKKDSTTSYFKRWASEGPLYASYATWLIKKYPVQYAESFLLPNSVKYLVPPGEFLATYNMGGDSVKEAAKAWFNYKSSRVYYNNKKRFITVTSSYSISSAITNALWCMCFFGFFLFKVTKNAKYNLANIFLLASTLWILNISFSIFASPIVLRYQFFILLTICSIAITTIESFLIASAKNKSINNSLS